MQPGLMNSVCVLVGLAFGMASRRESEGGAIGNATLYKPFLGKTWAYPLIGLVVGGLAMADFARTTFVPRWRVSEFSSSDSRNAFAGKEPSLWQDLVKIDPFDPELPRMAAYQCVEEIRRNDLSASTRTRYTEFLDVFCQDYLTRDPNHWIPFMEAGRWQAALAETYSKSERTKDAGTIAKQRSYEYFCEATKFYPNSAQTRLQAAVGAAWSGKTEEARLEREKAALIDRETPHADRKLSGVVVFFPKELDSEKCPVETGAWVKEGNGDAKGEPILRWLRTNIP